MSNMWTRCLPVAFALSAVQPPEEVEAAPATVLVEAESFSACGGWVPDTQFIEIMGSPYLLAHGLGVPVADATTAVAFTGAGTWHVWVRTKDWVARWGAPGQPGRFQVWVNGEPLKETFGSKGADWHWQYGGAVNLPSPEATLTLRDLTGFDGRCDAIYFARDAARGAPPDGNDILPAWRRASLGLPEAPRERGPFDLVVVGGGYAGMCAAIAAARGGLKVALVQDRPVLGGNASSEVAVPLRGQLVADGPYPRLGEIVAELQYDARDNARPATEKDDARHERIVRAESNVTLLLNHHAYAAEMDGGRIAAVLALDTRSNACTRLAGRLFADCTGHGTIGALAGADCEMALPADIVMGMTQQWDWEKTPAPQPFPETPWALYLNVGDFPPNNGHGGWNWESGYYRDPIADLEYIRDWNLRAVFGTWNALKNRGGAQAYAKARLTRVGFVGGVRESRRLLGDVVLSEDHLLKRAEFDDGLVPVTWFLDRHHPHPAYAQRYPDDPFIAESGHKPGTDLADRPRHKRPWWGIPYRCLYSRNVPNLFMAGRDISTTPWALGAVRVMRTGGMMGEVVGAAAAICKARGATPRQVYASHLGELKKRFLAAEPDGTSTYRRFRVIEKDGKVAATEPLATAALPLWAKDVQQKAREWKAPDAGQAYFRAPAPFVIPPEAGAGEPFYPHNHSPALAWLPNGDLLAVWFSTVREQGTEMTILGARLRAGAESWDPAAEFFKAADRNMTGSSLFFDESAGVLHHLNGMGRERAEGWELLALLYRSSRDQGVTWSAARPVSSGADYRRRHQVIAGLSRVGDGALIQPCDASPGSAGDTAIHVSRDAGRTWSDPGGDIRGIHAGVAGLKDGGLLAFGRGRALDGRMPLSLSRDFGRSWSFRPALFPPLGGGQRLALLRLREGPLLLVAFATGKPAMTFADRDGKAFVGTGLYAALSYDEGATWPARKLLTPGAGSFEVGAHFGAKVRRPPVVETSPTQAEPEGYLAATQSPDGAIHLVSSRLYYRFNARWIETPPPPPAP